jgi:hypothetical protein
MVSPACDADTLPATNTKDKYRLIGENGVPARPEVGFGATTPSGAF